MLIKKGAMFGLDARIALAIFGALSVISGAALYSAIQEAKVTQYAIFLEAISKATIAYVLDTGQELPAVTGSALNLTELESSTVSGWAGPYFTDFNSGGDDVRSSDSVSSFATDDSGNIWVWKLSQTTGACVSNCALFVRGGIGANTADIYDSKVKMIEALDYYFDNGDGGSAGSFRYITNDTSYLTVYYYRIMNAFS